MKQRNLKKKVSALLLAVAMTVTTLPQLSIPVHATDELPANQFATKEELKNFNTNDNDGTIKPAKVYFGNNNQQWWIAGSQSNDSMILFAASPLENNQLFVKDPTPSDRDYKDEWGCTYEKNPVNVCENHYGASTLRTTLQELESSYFTSAEQKLMNNTTIYTNDSKNNSIYSTTNKLYLAYGKNYYDKYVTVGTNTSDNLDNGLHVDMKYWGEKEFWLRAPDLYYGDCALIAIQGKYVFYELVFKKSALVPAFELNLSSVLFASAAPAASSDGKQELQDVDGDGAFTLRYRSDEDLGSAEIISEDRIKYADVSEDEEVYLVVQNSEGAWARDIYGSGSISAKRMGVESFENCKVWLEYTKENMTYAELQTQKTDRFSVNITGNTGLDITTDNGTQSVDKETEIADIFVEPKQGYYLPDNYIESIQGLTDSGLNAEKTEKGFKISGVPTKDVAVTLPAATEKEDRKDTPNVTGGIGSTINDTDTTMEYASSKTSDIWTSCTDKNTEVGAGTWYVRYKETDTQKASAATEVEVISPTYTITVDDTDLTFATKNEGYESVDGQTVTITNTGNSKVTLEEPTGTYYDIALSNTDIEPSKTATLTITPKKLNIGDYNETIVIKTTQGTGVTVSAHFKVNGAFNVSLSASTSSIIEGESVTLTAKAFSGSGTYAYTWYANGEVDSSLIGNEVTVSPTVTTTYEVMVTDTIENKSASATITVIPKKYDLEVPDEVTWDSQHIGYTTTDTKRVIVTNIGNVKVSNMTAVFAGDNADAFTLDTTGLQKSLSVGEQTSFSVTPVSNLTAGTYTAEIQISGDNVHKTVPVTFTVTDHVYNDVVTPPTCVNKGYTTHTCIICKYSFVDSETATTSHVFKNYVSNHDATCTQDGTETAKCENCDAIDTREIADSALGHEFDNYQSDGNATCTENGTETSKCKRCDVTDTREIADSALGHDFSEWKVTKEPTVSEKGEKVRTCSRCGTEEKEILPALDGETDKDPSGSDKPAGGSDKTDNDKSVSDNNKMNSGGTKTDNAKTAAKTGDRINILLWELLFISSCAGVIYILYRKKQKSNQ